MKGFEMKRTMMDAMTRMRVDGARSIASRESMIAALMMPDASGPGQAVGASSATAVSASEPISALGRLILRLATWTPTPRTVPASRPAMATIAKETTL